MKKILVTILALVYLTASIGATVRLHYCMDKLVSWGFGQEKTSKKSCQYCGMARSTEDKHCAKESEGCCKDEQKVVKLENDQKTSVVAFEFLQMPAEAIIPGIFDYAREYVSSLTEKYPLTHSPPRAGTMSLFVLNCIFLI